MLDIRELGAEEGGRTDCTAVFQEAVDRAKAAGDKIFVPIGTYLIEGELRGLDNVFIEGVASNKQYWPQEDDFATGASVLVGGGANALFAGDVQRATIDNLCFTNFAKIAQKTSPRSMRFRNCSFKNMVVLDAPSGEKGAYHNFRFFGCDFTNYGIDATFKGRIIDSVWKDCTFVGAAAFDLVQGKANLIAHNRFEWIDRPFAVAMYACEYVQLIENFFDRVLGNAVILKQGNRNVHIAENLFNRCGSGLTAGGKPADPPLAETGHAFIQLYGELENVTIQNNVFCKGDSGDRGGVETPKYVLSKEPDIPHCRFTFKGNLTADAYTDRLLYAAGGSYAKITADTDAVYPALTADAVELAKISRGPVAAYNSAAVQVKEIPPNLIVHNAGGEIELAPGGIQAGLVYGGRVNGRPRYSRDETVFESVDPCRAEGKAGSSRIVYEVPVSRSMAGAPHTLNLLYRTQGSPSGEVELRGEDGRLLLKLPPLPPAGEQRLYTETFVVSEAYLGQAVHLHLYASRDHPDAAGALVEVEAVSVGYGRSVSRAFTDRIR
ncbi:MULTISPECIES: glycosyl hydrolase family 28-related protein [Paenibacillus]|uniref:glycosyl hydrolase family 28-related protein n=1 Tax=Paenibacillus TaxID=44249 RepID=UPI0022B93440|nr:glycosyl hydrolase family 28-related protein [Paenibacillus caseinilyticus]MCZ8518152.1 glycosyl hydrolase family 28-related protein [Paenibacillus caseinilyticus]